MVNLAVSALFGAIGGLIRALVGLLKHYRIDKNTKFKINYFFVTLVVSALIGTFVSLAFSANYIISLVIGYAGTDLLENLVRAVKRKKNW